MAVKAQVLDMTDVKDSGGLFNKKHRRPGDYKAKITKVEDARKKDDPKKKMWLFTIEIGTGTYPYYCTFDEKSLWKIKQLFAAAGIPVPKKRVKLDPNKLLKKFIGVTLDDDTYGDKLRSSIESVFPTSELEEEGSDEEDEDDIDDEDEEEDEEQPKKKVTKKAAAKPPAKAAKGKKGKKGKKKAAVDDDELEELDVEDI